MSGETDIQKLVQGMKPRLNQGEFVFCILDSFQYANSLNPLCLFQEEEGVTVIIPKHQADNASLSHAVVCAWITLTVYSSLEAVGLTAAVSKALTDANISCNVIAAYHHDHIFVPIQDAQHAMKVLENLSENE
jgi:hypothetical protein